MNSRRFTFLSAVHVFLIRDGAVLLLRRANSGYKDGNHSVPAGHFDGNESVFTAAILEAREEVGVELVLEDVQVVGVMHRGPEHATDVGYIDFFLASNRWNGVIVNGQPHNCDELRWAQIDELPEPVIPFISRALSNYRSNRWFDTVELD